MKKMLLPALALSLALLGPAQAGNGPKATIRGVAENGNEVKKSVYELTHRISWQTSLDQAKALAAKEGKLIFWWQLLGELDGTT